MADVSKILKGGLKAMQEAESAAAKSARAIGKKPAEVLPPFERAPAKSKEEIDEIARRIAPQITGEFVRLNPKQSVNPAGLSRKRFEIEKELEHDIRPVKEVREPESFDYAANKGKVQLGVFGDPTITQQDIYEVGGRKLALPSRQYGGPRYPVYEPEDAWASQFGAASGVQSAAERASKQYGGVDVIGLYTKMGADSYYYAQHLSDALMKNIMPSLTDMSKKDIAGFNKMVRNNPDARDFAGIENPDIALAQMEKNPEMRKQFSKLATTPKYTNAFNMPNGLDVVHATLEPELRNLERGITGHTVVELDPSIKELHAADHPTYDTRIPRKAGTEVRKLEVPTPIDIQYPDQLLNISKNPEQAGPRSFGTLMMSGARQIIDPQHIDEIGTYRDFIKKYTGKKKGGAVKMADGGKVFKAAREILEDVSKADKPSVNRIDMNYKDVTKRVPELTEAANKLDKGEITAEDYDYLVNLYKPVKPYDFVPQPATSEEALRALSKNKQPMFKRAHEIEIGEPTDLRLDIPAYRDHGVWINSIHRKDAPTVYDTVSSVKNAKMIGAPEKALKVAKGETSKSPFAVIRGEWNPTDEKTAVENVQKYLNDKDWVQVGYDPERHGYFYNRQTMEPVESAEEVIQIGPLVLAKKPKYAAKKEQKFDKGGAVEDDSGYIEEDPVVYLMNKIKPVDTKITSAEEFRRHIGKPIPLVNEAIEAIREDVKKLKPRAAIDIPVNAVSELAGQPGELLKTMPTISPIRSDIVVPKDKAKGFVLPKPLPSVEDLKKATTDIGLTSGEDYPALQFAAGMAGAPEIKAIGRLAKAGVKGYGNLIKEGIERNIHRIEPRMGIIKDPGGMVIGGERVLDDELTRMYKNESIDNYDGTYGDDHNAAALNKWINTKVRKYIRNQAGTESDPILKAIESGVQHNFAPLTGDAKYYTAQQRKMVGKPEEGISKTDLGKEWEFKVDSTFTPKKSADIKEILNNPMEFADPGTAERRRASLLRVEQDLPIRDEKDVEALRLINQIPDKNVYTIGASNITNRLGLNHVGDVLYEDLAAGRITPQQLDQMSIEKAVRRTAEYDAQKAREMTKAHATSVEGMPVPKQYDDGYKWVELKHGTDKEKTKGALKSEGEMMGHCVGSYCPEVLSGRTQIFSLRGPDNKSHVTVEVSKKSNLNSWLKANQEEINKDPLIKQMTYPSPDERYPGQYTKEETDQAYIDDITKMLNMKGAPVHEAPDAWLEIVQVKGKQNKRPDDKYQKYVTDFVKSNLAKHEIVDIHELNNTDLRDIQNMIATGLTSKSTHMHPDVDKAVAKMNPHLADKFAKHGWSEEIGDAKYELLKNIGRDFASKNQYYVTDEDILNAVREKHLKAPGKKRGGPITKKDLENQMKLDDIVDTPNLRRRYG